MFSSYTPVSALTVWCGREFTTDGMRRRVPLTLSLYRSSAHPVACWVFHNGGNHTVRVEPSVLLGISEFAIGIVRPFVLASALNPEAGYRLCRPPNTNGTPLDHSEVIIIDRDDFTELWHTGLHSGVPNNVAIPDVSFVAAHTDLLKCCCYPVAEGERKKATEGQLDSHAGELGFGFHNTVLGDFLPCTERRRMWLPAFEFVLT